MVDILKKFYGILWTILAIPTLIVVAVPVVVLCILAIPFVPVADIKEAIVDAFKDE